VCIGPEIWPGILISSDVNYSDTARDNLFVSRVFVYENMRVDYLRQETKRHIIMLSFLVHIFCSSDCNAPIHIYLLSQFQE